MSKVVVVAAEGDTLDSIAKDLGVTASNLADVNNIQVSATLTAGRQLEVPDGTITVDHPPAPALSTPTVTAPAGTPTTPAAVTAPVTPPVASSGPSVPFGGLSGISAPSSASKTTGGQGDTTGGSPSATVSRTGDTLTVTVKL